MNPIHSIEILFENTESVVVKGCFINEFQMTNIVQNVRYDIVNGLSPNLVEGDRAEGMTLELLADADADSEVVPLGEVSAFKRIAEYNDIVGVIISAEKGRDRVISVYWSGNGEENEDQESALMENGNLCVAISKSKEERDAFFAKCAMKDSLCMEIGNLLFGNSRGKYRVDRNAGFEDALYELFDAVGIDDYGYVYDSRYASEDGGFENDTFVVRPYYWGDDDERAYLPNFEYKPTGYKLEWYKYPLRDSFQNQDLGVEAFAEIIKKCINSI